MAETLAALLAAHMLADFLFQSNWMVQNKHRLPGMAAHLAVVLLLNLLILGQIAPVLIALSLLHLGIDLIKTGAGQRGPLAFLADQTAHLASLAALAALQPDLWATSAWANHPALPGILALLAGAIAATQAGGYLIALFMAAYDPQTSANPGLPGGGRAIGLLERGLIFLLVLMGEVGATGFLIAAKSILRFGTVKDDRKISEYVIIGTLASFLWAILVAKLTLAALTTLPDLGLLTKLP